MLSAWRTGYAAAAPSPPPKSTGNSRHRRLAALPTVVAEFAGRWSLRLGPPYQPGELRTGDGGAL